MPENTSETRSRKYIRDFEPSQRFEGTFCIANAQLGRTRADKPYLRCLLSDSTGELPGRMWNADEGLLQRISVNGFVRVEGETQPFQGELQLIIHNIMSIEPTSDELRDLLPRSAREPEEMFVELKALLDTVAHPAMKALLDEYLSDDLLMDMFRTAPAAKMMHHAYLGGLLEHTLSLLNLADRVCPLYPRVNRDIVLIGLFLHDIGKTRELSYQGAFDYTDRGLLVGHIVDGAIMLHDKAQSAMRSRGVRFPKHAITVLQHIILSHHTEPEYGAAKVPATPEALLVAMLDNLDAKMAIGLSAARPERTAAYDLGGNFTEKQWALGTRLFRPDPLD